jgi:hypothetical protein
MRLVPHAVEASVVLFMAAEALVFVLIGSASFPVIGAWALAAVGVWSAARSVRSVRLRKALALLLIAACLVMATQAGLFFVPAAVALAVAAFTTRLAEKASSS